MHAATFYRCITMDNVDFLGALIDCLQSNRIRFCVVGGQAVNAYVEPLVSLDLDIVVAADQLGFAEEVLGEKFQLERFPHSLNVTAPDSELRVQIQLDPKYRVFVDRSGPPREVLGRLMPVASIADVLQGKVWAYQDTSRRPSKRQKDLADIARIIEHHPHLSASLPGRILERLGNP
jgi:hypothetical protein